MLDDAKQRANKLTGAKLSGSVGTVTFGKGKATAVVTADPTPDTLIGPGDEDVVLTIDPGTSYLIGASSATGTITEDDVTPTVDVMVSPAGILENGAQQLIYTFARTDIKFNPLTVNFSVGEGANDATFTTDYTQSGAKTFSATAGTIRFGTGQSTAIIAIKARPDVVAEPVGETVRLKVLSGSGYDVGIIDTAIGTIFDELP